MNNEESDHAIEVLSHLNRERKPPDDLEDRVVKDLRKRNLLRRNTISRTVWLSIAATIAAFALGIASAKMFQTPAHPVQYTYLLLLRESPGVFHAEHEESLVREYSQWARSIAKSGMKITGEKLQTGSRILTKETQILEWKADPDGAIAGFFMIEAATDQEALDTAMQCPHLRYGGAIELRRIDLTR